MLTVTELHYEYPEISVLENVSFSITEGVVLHVKGANGSGKTTLLRILAGLLPPTHGSILFRGKVIDKHLIEYQRSLCYVGHKIGISLLLTVEENLRLGLLQVNDEPVVQEALVRLSLQHVANVPCYSLSMGQRRRVGLARLFLKKAPLWFLDEPLIGLDHHGINVLKACMEQHLSQRGLIVITSHQSLPLQQRYVQEYSL